MLRASDNTQTDMSFSPTERQGFIGCCVLYIEHCDLVVIIFLNRSEDVELFIRGVISTIPHNTDQIGAGKCKYMLNTVLLNTD